MEDFSNSAVKHNTRGPILFRISAKFKKLLINNLNILQFNIINFLI